MYIADINTRLLLFKKLLLLPLVYLVSHLEHDSLCGKAANKFKPHLIRNVERKGLPDDKTSFTSSFVLPEILILRSRHLECALHTSKRSTSLHIGNQSMKPPKAF